jgi:RNA-directed DNA polymerase
MAYTKAPKAKQALDSESESWNKLPWRKLEQHVYRIQKRIFKAKEHGNQRAVQTLQKLLMKSRAAQLLAVRRVTQDNQGKKTAGIDGVKSVAPKQRLAMVECIHPKRWKRIKAQPVRRIYIPKPGKAEKRPLGIPVIVMRAQQALAKSALEPEWEACFEANSYGFRPGRCCQDAIQAIFLAICKKPKYVLDADIAGCFDHIDQEALHGLETFVVHELTRRTGKKSQRVSPTVIRYAGDFVVLDEDLQTIEQAKEIIAAWLKDMGLELKASKTQITHTLLPYQGKVGFNFLGWTVRQFPVGKTHTGTGRWGNALGFKTIITPSKEAVKRHPHKGMNWISNKYWHVDEGKGWSFTDRRSMLWQQDQTEIQRHIKIKGTVSPYNGDLRYWSKRLRTHPMLNGLLGKLLQKQTGKCRWCELLFPDGDIIEIDHITPRSQGGGEELSNKMALHWHCHDQRHARRVNGTHDKGQISEEPDDANVSRPVLKPSGGGDSLA